MKCIMITGTLFVVGLLAIQLDAQDLAEGVRGVATRAPSPVVMDGDLSEFQHAFCTPINYFPSRSEKPSRTILLHVGR